MRPVRAAPSARANATCAAPNGFCWTAESVGSASAIASAHCRRSSAYRAGTAPAA
jgi:hypothetical protein